jgi:hypothetical protein
MSNSDMSTKVDRFNKISKHINNEKNSERLKKITLALIKEMIELEEYIAAIDSPVISILDYLDRIV